MNEFERYVVTTIIFLSIVAMVVIFSRKLWINWYRRHSHLERMAIQSMCAWAIFIPIVGLSFFFFGKEVVNQLAYVCCVTGTMPIVLLQYRFKGGTVDDMWTSRKGPVFDERDYRIGQEALQNAYLVFWILVWIVGITLFLAYRRLEFPYWSVMLILPVIAMIVSLVHALSILILYRRENREVVEDG